MVTVPVDVDPDSAREAAARELADPAYQAAEPSFLEQVLDHIGRFLANTLSVGLGGVGLVILLLLVVAVFAVVRLRVGGLTRSRRTVFTAGREHRSADDHRRAAELALSRGELTEAVRERFRAIVRELESRGVLDERSGRTVDEIARTAGQRMPARASELNTAATLFDDVVYGGRPPTEAAYHDLAALDARIQAENLVSR